MTPLHLTFNKKSHREGKAVHADRHQPASCADEQDYSIDPEEQVHGAVLPVHQLNPGVVLSVIEVGVRPAHHKLFHHYTCAGTSTVTPDGSAGDAGDGISERTTHPQMRRSTPRLPRRTSFS